MFSITRNKSSELKYLNPFKEKRSSVATLDGVFLATRKEVWKEIQFDEKLIKGFHGYDLDFTLRAAQRFHNYVVLIFYWNIFLRE